MDTSILDHDYTLLRAPAAAPRTLSVYAFVASGTGPSLYVPSVAEVEKLPKFPSRVGMGNWGCDTYRGALRDVRGLGVLPIVSQSIRDQRYPEKDKGQVEREMYMSEERQSRLFDRTGNPDHGTVCEPE